MNFLIDCLGISRSSIYERIKCGMWTRPMRLGGTSTRSIGWPRHEVDLLCDALIKGVSDDELKLLVRSLESNRI